MVATTAPPADLRPERAYTLPAALRGELAQAFGPVVATTELKAAIGGAPIIAVGDMVSRTCKQLNLTPRLIVCDYHTQRGKMSSVYRKAFADWGAPERRVQNPPGTLSREAWDHVREALGETEGLMPKKIVVEGEEDLLGLPAFLEAPDGAVVLYGMPAQGVCVVTVTPELKAKAASLVARLTPVD